ncbi:hypothetical protein [Streptomyces zaomyceticus]|uniref:hypothetical protein n=1 Tax=Streptomyces zaomyceticus TaxID=68286 RepID=UPI0033A77C41
MTEPAAELPAEQPVSVRADKTSGDVAALIDLGVLEPHPEPPPDEPAPQPIPEG